MALEHVSLSWVRGSAETATLQPAGKSVVVYGSNGSGKSTFVDALEYIINGRVTHLAIREAGTSQTRAMRNVLTPANTNARIEVKLERHDAAAITIHGNGRVQQEQPAEPLNHIRSNWKSATSILRQDEVANFITAPKGEKCSVLLPILGLSHLEVAAENLRKLHFSVASESRLTELEVSIRQARANIIATTGTDDQSEISKLLDGLAKKYSLEQARNEKKLIEELKKTIDKQISGLAPAVALYNDLIKIRDTRIVAMIRDFVAAHKKVTKLSNTFLQARIQALQAGERAIVPGDPEEIIQCPTCGQDISRQDLQAHIAEELKQLQVARSAITDRDRLFGVLQTELTSVKRILSEPAVRKWLQDASREAVRQVVDSISKIQFPIDPDERAKVAAQLIGLFDNLHPMVTEATKAAPESIEKLRADENFVTAVFSWNDSARDAAFVAKVQAAINAIKLAESAYRAEIESKTQAVVESISQKVQDYWGQIFPDKPITGIRVYTPHGEDKAVDIALNFYGVDQPSPRISLSEGQRNALGLCIFLALAAASDAKEFPIVLDDVVTSLDREHRDSLTHLLVTNFTERQLLIFTHDIEWFLDLSAFVDRARWDFLRLGWWVHPTEGITWQENTGTFGEAWDLQTDHPEAAGNRARVIFEGRIKYFAEMAELELPFFRGDRNDHRDLLPLLETFSARARTKLKRKNGKSYEEHQEGINALNEAIPHYRARANRASHAGALSPDGAAALITAFEAAIDAFRCQDCGSSIGAVVTNNSVECGCRTLRWTTR